MRIKKGYIVSALLFLLIIILIVTNPTKNDYLDFIDEQIGPAPKNVEIEIERINFYVFSTYTPIVHSEYGMTYLGVFNTFFEISDGQFDYPWWLEFFN